MTTPRPACDICHRHPATLDVPVQRAYGPDFGRVVRTEHWCEPCRDRVFPGDKTTAWYSTTSGWIGEKATPTRRPVRWSR